MFGEMQKKNVFKLNFHFTTNKKKEVSQNDTKNTHLFNYLRIKNIKMNMFSQIFRSVWIKNLQKLYFEIILSSEKCHRNLLKT